MMYEYWAANIYLNSAGVLTANTWTDDHCLYLLMSEYKLELEVEKLV